VTATATATAASIPSGGEPHYKREEKGQTQAMNPCYRPKDRMLGTLSHHSQSRLRDAKMSGDLKCYQVIAKQIC